MEITVENGHLLAILSIVFNLLWFGIRQLFKLHIPLLDHLGSACIYVAVLAFLEVITSPWAMALAVATLTVVLRHYKVRMKPDESEETPS